MVVEVLALYGKATGEKLLAVYFKHRGLVYSNPKYGEDEIGFPSDWPKPERGETKGNN